MIQEGESKTVNKVPLLGDIPVIGTVFRSTTSKKTKSEMVIMLTPKIITDNEDAVAASDNL
jgi:type IV pilus assembly protein PilQ